MLATMTASWSSVLSEALRVLAFGLVGIELFRLFDHPQATILGRRRWSLALAMVVLAVLQGVMFLAAARGAVWLVDDARLIGAFAMLASAVLLWPFLAHVRAALLAARDEAVQARLHAAEARAAEARSWLLLAEEIAQVGHWRLSAPENALFWSDEIFRIHGMTPSKVMPDYNSAINAFHPEDREMVRDKVTDAIEHGAPYELQARLMRPDGRLRHVLSRGRLETDMNGEVKALFGVFVDITAQKLVESHLLAEQVKSERDNRSLHELAMRDSLTGLPNRRQFDRELQTEIKRALRNGPGFGLVMIDIDHFKQYNDQYGHPAGDQCLRRVADAIADATQRPGDQVARYGGEEFVVLLPGVDEAGAATVALRVIEAVRDLDIAHERGMDGHVTVSCGVAAFDPGAASDQPAEIIERADQALYDAKRAGRDQLIMAKPAPLVGREHAANR